MEKVNKEKVQESRKVQFYLVLPVLILPFMILGFWAMGGGKGVRLTAGSTSGFNPELPEAKNNGKSEFGKTAAYEQARKDSIRQLEARKQDPYYSMDTEGDGQVLYPFMPYEDTGGFSEADYQDPNERKVYEKLEQLNATLNQAQSPGRTDMHSERTSPDPEVQGLRDDIARLEDMMKYMQSGSSEPDPEMQQINSVLESVLDIQHPERVQERLRQQSAENTGQVFAVSAMEKETPVTFLDNKSVVEYAEDFAGNPDRPHNSFYGLGDLPTDNAGQNAIEAVVHETQTLVSGSTVKLRLMDDVFINGQLVPKDNFVFGIASLQGERLEIEIESIRSGKSLFPVKLSVHDIDGLAGIRIPGAISRDVAKQSGDQTLQSMNLGTFNPSLGAQAASAGIELGKNLLSRKIKLIKVEVKAGYRVFLKDGKKRDY